MPDDTNDSADDLPESYQGDRLFRGALDWHHNAVVDFWSLEWDSYARGYKNGADCLVERVLREPAERDVLVFPIIFLYRQYLELRMKDTIVYGSDLLGSSEPFPSGHRLDELWRRCRSILEAILPGQTKEELDRAGLYVLEFSEKDVTSQAFRYPTDRQGEPALPFGIINLRLFRDTMAWLAGRLDNFSEEIFERRREKAGTNRIDYCGHKVASRSEQAEENKWSPVAKVFWILDGSILEERILSQDGRTFSTRGEADEHAAYLAMRWVDEKLGR